METVLDALTAVGILVLALPVLNLNRRKKAHAAIQKLLDERASRGDSHALDEIALVVERRRAADAGRWRRRDEICLYVGYVSLLGASIARIFV